MNPTVAVIIPCYNYGKYLEEAVDSALASTYPNIEIIIVDDGSTDQYTIEVLKVMKDKPKTKVIHRVNGGLSAARNTGITAANTKYILPLDADDLIDSTFIEKGVQILEQASHIAFVYPLVKLFGEVEGIWQTLPFNFHYLKFRNYIPATIIMRRKAWEDVSGYDERMRDGYEDWEFILRLGKRRLSGQHINEVLFFYRKHKGSMLEGSKKKEKELKQRIRELHPDLYRFRYIQFSLFVLMELRRRVKQRMSH